MRRLNGERRGAVRWRGPLLLVLLWMAAGAGAAGAQEVVQVQVAGQPVFPVVQADTLGAAARAQQLTAALAQRINSPAPLGPIQVVPGDSAAALLVGADTLVRVTARDAEVRLGRAVPAGELRQATAQVAREWADALMRAFTAVARGETAQVVVQGNPAFTVAGTPEVRAATRAATVAGRIARLATAEEEVRIEVGSVDGMAAVLADGEPLVEVLPADTAAFDAPADALAERWAARTAEVVEDIRWQGSPVYLLWVGARALGALLVAAALHWVLRRLRRRKREEPLELEHGSWGLGPVIARAALSALQFLVWAAAALYVLWLIPRTRPLTFALADGARGQLGGVLEWLASYGLVVALIVVVTVFVARFTGSVVEHLIVGFGMRQGGRIALRASTLAGTASAFAEVIVFLLGLLTVLAQMGVDLVPLLAGAGVAGIAIGFGVQSLIRDFFTGFFILLEDQYGVGDVIRLGDVTGKVERFTLRITQVRGLDGSLTSVPNGEILRVTNMSKDWAQVVLDVNIELGEDVGRATQVIQATAHQLATEWDDRIVGEPEVLGVETIDPLAQAVAIRLVVRTAPLERWSVTREIRRRVLQAFDDQNIRVPPRSVVTLPNAGAAVRPGGTPSGGPGASGF